MVGGPDYQDAPFNLATNGHRQPGSSFKPFTLVTALEQGHSTGEVYTSAPQEIPFRVKVREKNGNGTKVVNDLFDVNNYNDSYLGSASIATATTYSDNSVYSQLGTQVGPENVAATANAMGIETDLSTETEYSIADGPFEPYNPALILGGLETGVTPLEMAHAYNTLAADGQRLSGTMAASSGGPVGDRQGHATATTTSRRRRRRARSPDQTGASGENELDRQAGDRPDRRRDRQGRALDRRHLRHRPSARRPASRPGARPAPPTTTATPGSAARPRRSPPASGSATPTRVDADGDRVRRRTRSTAAPSRR